MVEKFWFNRIIEYWTMPRGLDLVAHVRRGRVQVVQVTETTRDAIEVRLLMSAKDSPTLFDLRCDIREGMLEWLADHQPEAFARLRLLEADAGPAAAGPA